MKSVLNMTLIISVAALMNWAQTGNKTSTPVDLQVAGANRLAGSTSVAEPGGPKTAPLLVNIEYWIGAGDVLEIVVWKEPDASVPTATVRPDGKISIPFIKEIHVAGLTPSALETMLTQKLSAYFRNPQITVLVKEVNSQKIYVIGEVKKEGAIRLQAPMTVLQVLAEAGGITDYAKRSKIQIYRIEGQKQKVYHFDYSEAVRGIQVEQNFQVLPGDTIVVPR